METVWIVAAVAAAAVVVVVLLLMARGKERVIDAGGATGAEAADQPSKPDVTGADESKFEATGPGELLEFRGKDDAECGLADWLMADVAAQLGSGVSEDRMVITRVADAALKASAELRASGRATVELPFLAADASGPKSYRRDITRAEAELGMVAEGVLLVDELLQWRGRDMRTVALGEWLESEVDDEADSGSLDPASTIRVADAADAAVAEITRTGRAVVELTGLTRDNGGRQDFRRELDREALNDIAGTD
jgi:molecular chaperone DnaK (HSP70)